MLDPHAVKIYVDGNCWDNPGGPGGIGVRVDYGCDVNRECQVVAYQGYFETNNQRMEIRACIFAHEWIRDNLDDLGSPRFIILTDSTYVYGAYAWVLNWAQNGYCNDAGRPMKNDELWKELMTLRRKLGRRVRIDVKWIPRRSDEGAKEVDRTAKMAGNAPSEVDLGFPKGKIGRPKNNSKKAAKLFPATGQTVIIRPYKSDMARKDVQIFKFEKWDEANGIFFEKFIAYADNAVGNALHRQNVYEVRMNNDPAYPQILEIAWSKKEPEFLAERAVVTP